MQDNRPAKASKSRKKRALRLKTWEIGRKAPLPDHDVNRCGNHTRLPAGYRLAEVIDLVRNRKQLIAVNATALGLMAALVVIGLFIAPVMPALRFMFRHWGLWLALGAVHILYIVLHEAVHGVWMHALSGIRPNFGLSLAYAYAGSPVWFDRKCHILIALAPVTVFGILFGALCARLPGEWFWPVWTLQIANISGSAGDLYCVFHLSRLKGHLLIQDTGTRMRVMTDARPSPKEV